MSLRNAPTNEKGAAHQTFCSKQQQHCACGSSSPSPTLGRGGQGVRAERSEEPHPESLCPFGTPPQMKRGRPIRRFVQSKQQQQHCPCGSSSPSPTLGRGARG